MTAFNLEVLLLLAGAFVLGLALGLWLRRARRSAAEGEVMVPVPSNLPAAVHETAASVDKGAADTGEGAADDKGAGPPGASPSAERGSPAVDGAPEKEPARPPSSVEPRPPLREPVADLFGHLLNVPPGAIAEEPDDEPPRRQAGLVERVSASHPGVPPPVLAEPEGGVADDLKQLKGIGPQNERRLHALGIFHFRQIAAWTPEEAVWVGSYLAFPGRIEREDWIGQARALMGGTSEEAGTPREPDPEE